MGIHVQLPENCAWIEGTANAVVSWYRGEYFGAVHLLARPHAPEDQMTISYMSKSKQSSKRKSSISKITSAPPKIAPEDHLTLAQLVAHAREVCVTQQAEEVGIGGFREWWVKEVSGDVRHISFHHVLFRLPHWVEEHINKGWLSQICTSPPPSSSFE